jgi:hypothetical protein
VEVAPIQPIAARIASLRSAKVIESGTTIRRQMVLFP